MTIDPGDLIRSLEIEADEQVRRAEAMRAELESTSARAESRGGELIVQVDSAGALSDLRFLGPAESVPLDELSRLVLETTRRAQAKLVTQVNEVVSGFYGPTSETAAMITDTYASRYPAVEDDQDEDETGWHGGRR